MNKKQYLYAIVIALSVSGFFALAQSIIFGGGAVYLYDKDYQKISEMKYAEAERYLAGRVREISGFESFWNGTKHLRFWKHFVEIWLYYTTMCFMACIIFDHFRIREKSTN